MKSFIRPFIKQKNLVVILWLLFVLFVCLFVSRNTSFVYVRNTENFTSGPESNFVMYYANWCGHCKKMKPEFEKLMSSYKGKVKVMMIDAEADEHKELVDSQNLDGFPTVRYYANGIGGKFEEYQGGRTYDELNQYLSGK